MGDASHKMIGQGNIPIAVMFLAALITAIGFVMNVAPTLRHMIFG